MKKILSKCSVLLLYLFFLLYMTRFQWKELFDPAGFGMVSIGMLLLSVPRCLQTYYDAKKEKNAPASLWKKMLPTLSWNGLFASYIATVMTLLKRLYGELEPLLIARELALGCRPILYGLLFYVLFHEEPNSIPKGPEDFGDLAPKAAENLTANESLQTAMLSCITTEQLYQFFCSKGLTAREAEVAKLLYQSRSNREIAGELYIAETTVKKHVTHILEKLDVSQRNQIPELVSRELSEIGKTFR